MKALISGGGTGGHLTPGIALYQECISRGIETRYVLRDVDMRYSMCTRIAEADRILVHIQGISRRLSWRTLIHLFKILGVFIRIFGVIRRFRPDFILITGGYVSNPVALSALWLRIPLYMAEQNSVAGTTNRFYSRFARLVFTAFPQAARLRTQRVIYTGNPVLFQAGASVQDSRAFFSLQECSTVIGISGGSQGAQAINDTVLQQLDLWKEKKIGVIWSLGAVEYQRLSEMGVVDRLAEQYPLVRPHRFIDRMDYFFTACDIVITRAGASTISELILFRTPAVLIPIYQSPDDHQKLNALYLTEKGAGILLEEPSLNPQNLDSAVTSILSQKTEYVRALDSLQTPAAAGRILDILTEQLPKPRP